jgi:organic hydroperoxide reductase OsmC/OhrA
VTLGTIEGGAFGIAVELDMRSPDVDDETVRKVVDAAHEVCPCSNTTRATSR